MAEENGIRFCDACGISLSDGQGRQVGRVLLCENCKAPGRNAMTTEERFEERKVMIKLKCPFCGGGMSISHAAVKVRVVEGDTIRVRYEGRDEPVRLLCKVGQTATCPSCAKVSLVGISGFGGWLLLPELGLSLGVVANLWFLGMALANDWLVGELAVLYAAFHVYVTVLFFMKKPYTPTLMVALLLANLALALDGLGPKSAGAVILAAVWIPYFLVSKRVKATFGRQGVAWPMKEEAVGESGGRY